MAKKRTLSPYYGKRSQFFDSMGTKASRAGDIEAAGDAFDASVAAQAKRARQCGNPEFAERLEYRHERSKRARA